MPVAPAPRSPPHDPDPQQMSDSRADAECAPDAISAPAAARTPVSPSLLTDFLTAAASPSELAARHKMSILGFARWAQSPEVRDAVRAVREAEALHTSILRARAKRAAIESLLTELAADAPSETRRRAAAEFLRPPPRGRARGMGSPSPGSAGESRRGGRRPAEGAPSSSRSPTSASNASPSAAPSLRRSVAGLIPLPDLDEIENEPDFEFDDDNMTDEDLDALLGDEPAPPNPTAHPNPAAHPNPIAHPQPESAPPPPPRPP